MSNIDALNYHDIFLLNDDHEKDKFVVKGKRKWSSPVPQTFNIPRLYQNHWILTLRLG